MVYYAEISNLALTIRFGSDNFAPHIWWFGIGK